MKQLFISISLVFIVILAFAQDDHKPLMKGDESYKEGNYTQAEEEYMRAIEANPNSVKGHFNRGNAIYKGTQPSNDPEAMKERLNKAAESYISAIDNADNDLTKASAFHNLGNTYMEQQDFAKGIDAYKNALRLNPKDMDTKTNLQYALRQMQMQQQQQQQQQGEGEPQEGESQEDQEPQDPSEEKSDEEQDGKAQDPKENEKEDEKQEGNTSQEGDNKEEKPTPEEMSKEEVLRQLKVMDEEEKKVQEKLKKEQRSKYKSDKDW